MIIAVFRHKFILTHKWKTYLIFFGVVPNPSLDSDNYNIFHSLSQLLL